MITGMWALRPSARSLVVGGDHLEALQPEVDLDEPHDVAVVVGDQDHLVHP
jgi:hypothetical protein